MAKLRSVSWSATQMSRRVINVITPEPIRPWSPAMSCLTSRLLLVLYGLVGKCSLNTLYVHNKASLFWIEVLLSCSLCLSLTYPLCVFHWFSVFSIYLAQSVVSVLSFPTIISTSSQPPTRWGTYTYPPQHLTSLMPPPTSSSFVTPLNHCTPFTSFSMPHTHTQLPWCTQECAFNRLGGILSI